MRDMGVIQGSSAQAVPLVIGKDTVYVHTDIAKLDGVEIMPGIVAEDLYQYREYQYTKEEWRELEDAEFRVDTIYRLLCLEWGLV